MFDGVKPAFEPGRSRSQDTYELKTTSSVTAFTSGYATFSQVGYLFGQVLDGVVASYQQGLGYG